MNAPLWFWIVLLVMNLLSLLWMVLVLRDCKEQVRSQLWILGEDNRSRVITKKLHSFKLGYMIFMPTFALVSILLAFGL